MLRAISGLLLGPLAVACGGAAATSARADSGIAGRVLLGPTCPVERVGQSCERGFQTSVRVYSSSSHRLVRTLRSAASGRFRVRLPPGRYSLQGSSTGYPGGNRPVTVSVQVHCGRFTSVTIPIDTGIR